MKFVSRVKGKGDDWIYTVERRCSPWWRKKTVKIVGHVGTRWFYYPSMKLCDNDVCCDMIRIRESCDMRNKYAKGWE